MRVGKGKGKKWDRWMTVTSGYTRIPWKENDDLTELIYKEGIR